MNYFCVCKNKESCILPILSHDLNSLGSYGYGGDFLPGVEYTSDFMNKIIVDKPKLMIIAVCEDYEIQLPWLNSPISKQDLGWIIVIIDIFVIIALIMFIYFLENGQNNYVEMYNEFTLEMTDFSLKIEGIPDERLYSDNNIKFRDEALRALIIVHF
jgi:hypothetical protein